MIVLFYEKDKFMRFNYKNMHVNFKMWELIVAIVLITAGVTMKILQ